MSAKLERLLILPDCHFPYVDRRAWNLMLRVAADFAPDQIVTMGDFADFYSVSSHSKDPERVNKLGHEVKSVNAALDQLDLLGKGRRKKIKKTFISGNHCLSMDHRALTRAGWKTFEQLSVGEVVATRNVGGGLAWQPIQRLIKRPRAPNEGMYTYRTVGVSMRVTAHHKMVARTNGKEWTRSAEACPDTFDIHTATESNNTEYALSDTQLQLAAWASTDVHYTQTCSRVTFYQSEGKQYTIENLLNAEGIEFTKRVRDRDITEICGTVLKRAAKVAYEYDLNAKNGQKIRDLTGLSKKGGLPAWIESLSDRQWDVFVNTLVDCDGSRPTRGKTSAVFYGNLPICEDVQRGAITHGWRASIVEYRPSHFRVNLSKYKTLRIDSWKNSKEPTPLEEDVWCLTTENGNFFTERDGYAHVTGNCDRLERYLMDKAPELFDVVKIPELFKLQERGWLYVPYKQSIKIAKVNFTHDTGKAGANAHVDALNDFQDNAVIGHTHRLAYAIKGNAKGEAHVGAMFGWLGDEKKADYMHRVKANRDWAKGFGIGYIDPKTQCTYLTPVPIVKYTCVVEGVLYRG